MKATEITLSVQIDQIVDMIKQTNDIEKLKIKKELSLFLNTKPCIDLDNVISVLNQIRPHFIKKLGDFSDTFTQDEYFVDILRFSSATHQNLFGFKLGCFKNRMDLGFSYIGMNVYVNSEGPDRQYRHRLLNFFKENLRNWVQFGNKKYDFINSSFNNLIIDYFDGETQCEGEAFLKYRGIDKFNTEYELTDFLAECIDGLHNIYPRIIENPKAIFDGIHADYQEKESIIELCKSKIK